MKETDAAAHKKRKKPVRNTGFALGPTELMDTLGSATGELERAIEAGGWMGTDDAASTAPSDQIGIPPLSEELKPLHTIARDFDETIQIDEEKQQEREIERVETSESARLAIEKAKKAERHRLAAKVRAARKK
jgi:hypothetical protein